MSMNFRNLSFVIFVVFFDVMIFANFVNFLLTQVYNGLDRQ